MSSILICSTPVVGHITPLLPVARELVDAGHRVRILTGERYRDAVESSGATFVPLPAAADYDDRELDVSFPGRVGLTGPAAIRYDMQAIFLAPMPDQAAAVDESIAAEPVDVILSEPLFAGLAPLLGTGRPERPAILVLGTIPLGLSSRDTAPFGLGILPMPGPLGRLRNAVLRFVTQRVIFGPVQKEAERLHRQITGRGFPGFFLDWPSIADAIVQFSVPGFEYPRSDATTEVDFIGPVSRNAAKAGRLPGWWKDLDGSRPVVHVSQGTVANNDLEELLMPTIRGLADRDVLVVATTGGRDTGWIEAQLPENARVAEFLPYDVLFEKVDVFVTNGGYGGVHYALGNGVPIVVAGMTEDKAEVSARVQWSGTGINLRTNTPSAEKVATAVERVLADRSYRARAERLAAEIAASPGVAGILPIIERHSTAVRAG
jgi:UDP:flavonoid glycosyltransferase YjiC (YdhE family)